MKRKTFLRIIGVLGITALAITFLACSAVIQIDEQRDKANVFISVMDSSTRTVFPQVSLGNVATYKLFGGINGASETELAVFSTGVTPILLDAGMWNFTLNAYNSSGGHILQGKIQNRQISSNVSNELRFSLSALNSGMGAIDITLDFPVSAGITRISISGDTGSQEITSFSSGRFVYSKNMIAAGDYLVNFSFYRGDVLRAAISELVLVRSNLTSSKTITLVGEDLKRILSGTVTISPAASVTIGTELSASYDGTESVTWQWNKDGAAISGATGTKYTPNSTGSYTATASAVTYDDRTSNSVAVVGLPSNVPGSTLYEKLVWLANNAESYGNYVLEVSADETIPYFNLSYSGSGKSNIVITLRGTSSQRIISLSSGSSSMFIVNSSVTLVLDENITLKGRITSSSSDPLVRVFPGGFLTMNDGSVITGHNSFGSAVYVDGGTFIMNGGSISTSTTRGNAVRVDYGTFIMNGGTIFDNTNSDPSYSFGSGVGINWGTFIMNGGTISGNTSSSSSNSYGGGVGINDYGTFIMNGGTISGNTSSSSNSYGGGVYIASAGTFTMHNGTISGNIASSSSSSSSFSHGGGVYAVGTFTMNGGTISDNTSSSFSSSSSLSSSVANSYGGGVYVWGGPFTMNGGTISDNTSYSSSYSPFYSTSYGGGVTVHGSFTMNGGTISGNTSSYYYTSPYCYSYGGGVYVRGGPFTMNGGIISGNKSKMGGGVSVGKDYNYKFAKIGGTIYGDEGETSNNRNEATGGINTGHAVYVDYSFILMHRENTAGPGVDLLWDGMTSPPTFSGGWEF